MLKQNMKTKTQDVGKQSTLLQVFPSHHIVVLSCLTKTH